MFTLKIIAILMFVMFCSIIIGLTYFGTMHFFNCIDCIGKYEEELKHFIDEKY